MSNSRESDKFVVRLPDGLRDRITTLAKKNHRSMNSEIVHRLERSMVSTELCALQAQLIQQLSDRIVELEAKAPESNQVVSTTLPLVPAPTLQCLQAREHSGSRAVL